MKTYNLGKLTLGSKARSRFGGNSSKRNIKNT
jgi:hypothetical protein